MDSATTLFDHFADLPALKAEKAEVINIFTEIRSGIRALADSGFKIDTAKTVSQMQTAVKDINKMQDQLIAKTRELELFEQKLEALRAKNLETQLKIQKIQEDIKVKQAQQAKLGAQAEQARTSSLIEQEKELDRLIVKEEKRGEVARKNAANSPIVDTGLRVQGAGGFPAAPLVRFNPGAEEGATAATLGTKAIVEQGEAINSLEKAHIADTEAAIQWGAAQGEAVPAMKNTKKETVETTAAMQEMVGVYDEYTGTIRMNIQAQLENSIALQKNRAEQRAINKEILDTNVTTNSQFERLTQLRQEEVQLAAANKELNVTLKNQAIALRDNAGAATQLRAEYELLRQTYGSMSAAERVSPIGKQTKAQIDAIAPSIAQLDKEMLKGRHGMQELESSVERAGRRLYSFITRDLFRAIAGFIVFTAVFKGVELLYEKFIEFLNRMSDAEALAAEKLADLNEVMKSANVESGKQITDLKLLRQAAEDANLPIQTRVDAIKALKKEFPEHYKNISDEIILLGKDKEAYDLTTEAILKNSKAKAAKAKIDEIAAKKLDEEYNKEKINNATANESARVKGDITTTVATIIPGTGEQKLTDIIDTREEQLKRIADRKKAALDETEKRLKDLTAREDFLLKFVDTGFIVKEKTKGSGREPLGPTDEYYYKLLKQEQESAEALKKFRQQQEIEDQKTIEENEALNLEERIKARKKELSIEKQMLGDETEAKLNEIDAAANKEKARRKISQREIDLIEKDAQNKRNLVQEAALDKLALIEAKSIAEIEGMRKKARERDLKDEEDYTKMLEGEILKRKAFLEKNLKESSSFQNKNAAEESNQKIDKTVGIVSTMDPVKDANKIKLAWIKLEAELNDIELDRQARSIKSEIEYWKGISEATEQGTTEQIEATANWVEAEEKLRKLNVKKEEEHNKEILDAKHKLTEEYIKLGKELFKAGSQFLEATYDRQINKIQQQIDLIDELKAAEIARIEDTTASEQDKAAKIAILEAKAQSDKDMLAKRQRQAEREKAKFEKASKAMEITTEGIKTVNAIKLQIVEAQAKAAANPYDPFRKIAVALTIAQLPIAIATSAASLAAVLAEPLPGYWTGTSSAKPGLAAVAEKGRELAKEPSGRLVMYETPTIANLIGGTKIFNNYETENILKANDKERMNIVYGYSKPTTTAPDDRQLKELQKLNKKEFKTAVNVYNAPGVETTSWYQKNFKR